MWSSDFSEKPIEMGVKQCCYAPRAGSMKTEKKNASRKIGYDNSASTQKPKKKVGNLLSRVQSDIYKGGV